MKTLSILLVALWFCFTSEDNSIQSDSSLLTNGSQKSWYLAAKSPEGKHLSCKATSPQSMDNKYIFFADGKFELDHGEITEDPDCVDEGCCIDPVSIAGTWRFINEGGGLEVKALHKKDDKDYTLDHVLFEGVIQTLEEDRLVISASGIMLEFRSK
ncbi:hypothetical protein C900_04250 [Fulvivirga imtechensis AK7]|uniref:Lipocalin-like domain-containing protein n=1 Tax=Fulvivirga imtechensis AK7 TaxID=1237149 RepID=L8JYZ9_9BACT|nr:hypothetical protein [Fulvivirga imtechensis]ELR73398.1 hypothetical protein C900_04250 [Fulvivirga imtechensis AK7]